MSSPEIVIVGLHQRLEALHKLLGLPSNLKCNRRQSVRHFAQLLGAGGVVAFCGRTHQPATAAIQDLNDGLGAFP